MKTAYYVLLFLFTTFVCLPSLAQRYPPSSGGGCAIYSNQAALPLSAVDGTCAVTVDADTMWVFDLGGGTWKKIGAGGSTVIALGSFGSSPNGSGGSIASNTLTLQPADGTHPGGVSILAQTIAGIKTLSSAPILSALTASQAVFTDGSKALTSNAITGTGNVVMSASPTLTGTITAAAANFSGAISASNLSGTNTGDVTIGAFGAAPNNNGLSLSGQVINLQPADATHSGGLSFADWNTFNGKQASGSYITALTGDVTASGPGSAASTLATVNSNVGSFGTSTSIPSLTVNAKGLVTAASGNVVIAPAGTLTGTTLASNVVTSSLTTVGTIGTGAWAGTAVSETHGGTNQTSYTTGDIIYASGANTLAKLPIGSTTNVLTVTGGVPVWAPSGGFTPVVPSVQTLTSSSGTYTLPTSPSPIYIVVKLASGGGGGGGGGSALAVVGGTGGTSSFGTSLLSCTGGRGGGALGNAPGGPTAVVTVNGPAVNLGSAGGSLGGPAFATSTATANPSGGIGGDNFFGRGGPGGDPNGNAGGDAPTNSGAGGGGGTATGGLDAGGGGQAGCNLNAMITSPSSTYSYVIGSGGTAGAAGTSGSPGGAGGAGKIVVYEYYQ